MTRRRVLLLVLILLLAVYAAASIRHLRAADRHFVLDCPLLGPEPRVVPAGWRFVPRFVGRISEYPASQAKLRVDLSGEKAARSREGAKVEVESELAYRIPADRVLDLHRLRGPGYERAWLADLLRKQTADRLASVSYDLVRNRDPELAGGVRGALKEAVAREGLRIEGLRIFQTAGVGEASGSILRAGAAPLDRKVVVIGVDSFDWRIIDPLIRAGEDAQPGEADGPRRPGEPPHPAPDPLARHLDQHRHRREARPPRHRGLRGHRPGHRRRSSPSPAPCDWCRPSGRS